MTPQEFALVAPYIGITVASIGVTIACGIALFWR